MFSMFVHVSLSLTVKAQSLFKPKIWSSICQLKLKTDFTGFSCFCRDLQEYENYVSKIDS